MISRAALKRRRKLRLMKLFCTEEGLFSDLHKSTPKSASKAASTPRNLSPSPCDPKERQLKETKRSLLHSLSSNWTPENLQKKSFSLQATSHAANERKLPLLLDHPPRVRGREKLSEAAPCCQVGLGGDHLWASNSGHLSQDTAKLSRC